MDTQAIQKLAVDFLEDHKARDIKVIDVAVISDVTDVMVLASGTSKRHVKSLADNLAVYCKENNVSVFGSEGQESSEWVLVDLGDVLVHVMQEETREHYELEKLWDIEIGRPKPTPEE